MIPTISEDFSATVSERQNGDIRLRNPHNPRVSRQPHHCIPRWEKLVVMKAERGQKSTSSVDSHFLGKILPMIHIALGITPSDPVRSS
jgi:hypothetical protein